MKHYDERGTGGVEGLAFGVLLFVFGLLIVVNAWGVIDAKWATAAAAREAARAYVEAPNLAAAQASATQAAQAALAGRQHRFTDLRIDSPSYARCGVAVAEVTSSVPRVNLPLVGATGGTYVVRARHREIIDPYRSGVAGTAQCVPI